MTIQIAQESECCRRRWEESDSAGWRDREFRDILQEECWNPVKYFRSRGTTRLEPPVFGNPQLSWNSLAILCRSLATMLESGVPIIKSVQVAAGKARDPRVREAADGVVTELKKGNDVSMALRRQTDRFPELMIDMVDVADQTGSLPEVLSGLADHYDNLIRLRRAFLGAIAWPMFQLGAAILIIAGLMVIMGWLRDLGRGVSLNIFFGLEGTGGAVLWLGGWAALFAGGYVGYQMLSRNLSSLAVVHRLLLRIPVVGTCTRSFAAARFSWAFALTQQAGMNVLDSLEASLKATSNAAFIEATPRMVAMVREGEELTDAFADSGLFPRDIIEMVRVGESSGTVPETLQRLSPVLEDQARRSLHSLTMALGGLIWAFVAIIIIYFIFRLAMFYVGAINDAASGIM